jgi:hypothetical protein
MAYALCSSCEADYFGHKLHIDQNEKLVMFGVTHVVGIEGYSSKIVAYDSMPKKNNLKIYENVYRYAQISHTSADEAILKLFCLFAVPTLGELFVWVLDW